MNKKDKNFLLRIQQDKMKELWDNKYDEEWEKVPNQLASLKHNLKNAFGVLKLKKTTQQVLDESDKEAWDE